MPNSMLHLAPIVRALRRGVLHDVCNAEDGDRLLVSLHEPGQRPPRSVTGSN